MKILILGGTGAMGVSLVDILLENNNQVFVTSRSEKNSEKSNLKYIKGNAKDNKFINQILSERFDVIVDFMVYTSEEFKERLDLLLSSCNHYIYLSSSRVYAESENAITENSPRLLDISQDNDYLKTDEYALTKARQEDFLKNSKYKNWTIIRPYITYNTERLQLGVFEKDLWLYRALQGKTIVFSKEIAEKTTTLTYGYDVAYGISCILNKESAFSECFHITNGQAIKWKEVLEIYVDSIEKVKGFRPKVKLVDSLKDTCYANSYQVKYDRLFNRTFDNSKILSYIGEEYNFIDTKTGLSNSILEFISYNNNFKKIGPRVFAEFDKITNEKTKLSTFPSYIDKVKYFLVRYIL